MGKFSALWLSFLLLLMAASCSVEDEASSFEEKSPEAYNHKIAAGTLAKQPWTKTPYLIMNYLLGPETQAEPYPFTFTQVRNADASITATVTQERLPDDSVYGEKTILTFALEKGVWVVKSVRIGYKCREGRGHSTYYSGTWCD